LKHYLDVIVSNQDVEQSKPAPDIYFKAASLLSVKCCECLVIEDNPNGIAAANAAGAKVMVVRDPNDVTLDRIIAEITRINSEGK
jgi:HAD superfamily hydrolase (TIGR01509 family)